MKQRLTNIIISVPVLLLVCALTYVKSRPLINWIDNPAGIATGNIVIDIAMFITLCIFTIVLYLAACAAFLLALWVILIGDGFPWRKIEKGDYLCNSDGSIFKKFNKTEWILWWDSILRGRKIITYVSF